MTDRLQRAFSGSGLSAARLWLVLLCTLALTVSAPAAIAAAVLDGWGRQVTLEGPAERVVTLAPHLAEVMFTLDAGEQLVATVSHSDYPAAARELPRIGDAFNLSLEALLAQSPDLVLAWSATMNPARLARMEALGLQVFVSDPTDLEAVLAEMAAVATLVGRPQASALTQLRTRMDGHETAAPPAPQVLPLIAAEPLLSVGEGHFLNDLLRRCGGVNPFAGAVRRDAVVQLSREALLDQELDLVVNLTRASLPASLRLPAGTAVIELDPDLLVRPGPRMVEGLKQLCRAVAARGPESD